MRALIPLMLVAVSCASPATRSSIDSPPAVAADNIDWFDVLSREFDNGSLRILQGARPDGPVLGAIFQDSARMGQSREEQEKAAWAIAKFIFQHSADKQPVAEVTVGFEYPGFAGPNSVVTFRYPRAAMVDGGRRPQT